MTVAEPVVATQQNYDRAGARVQLLGMDSNTIGVGITASSASAQARRPAWLWWEKVKALTMFLRTP
jgi:hypothetical protein